MKKIPQDIIGNIALLKFHKEASWIYRKFCSWRFLKGHPNITTVLEKIDGFSGDLRIPITRHLAGIKTKEALYKENGCFFRFNVDEAYFSPRLSQERLIIAREVAKLCTRKKCKILIMFAGVQPYPIVLGKELQRLKKSATIFSNELNSQANYWGKQNIALNKLASLITLIPGDARNLPEMLKEKFDIILMQRPNLKETFLQEALQLSKKGTTIFYHGFGTKEGVLSHIKKSAGKKIGKITIRKAGDIGPYEFRWQAKFKVS